MAFPAFLDTCVLFGQQVTDLLLHLALRGCFVPYWSHDVLDEMERNVSGKGRTTADAVHSRRARMEAAFPEAMVSGYEALIGDMTNHPGDRHVLAACVRSSAHTLFTFNLKDFPAETLAPLGITAQHPDEFIEHAFGINPAAVIATVRDHRASLMHPHKTADELLDGYLKQGLVTTVSVLRPYTAQL